MDQLKKRFEKFLLKSGMINVILGFVLIISLAIVYRNPYNHYAILSACTAGGLINVISGLKMMRDTKRRQTGTTYLMMGVILIVVGFVIIQYVKK